MQLSTNIFYSILLLILVFTACNKPEPFAFKAKVGMKKSQVEKLLGEPHYSGAFVASVDSSAAYTPQRDRFMLFWVYPDSSLVVFKRDSVFEIYGNVRPFKLRLAQEAEKRRDKKQSKTTEPVQ